MINIAICDDDKTSANIIYGSVENIFLMHGTEARMFTYSSARALVEGMKNHVFDLILLDIEMPGTDGIALGRALRERGMRETSYSSRGARTGCSRPSRCTRSASCARIPSSRISPRSSRRI